jgi:hypothetical protein
MFSGQVEASHEVDQATHVTLRGDAIPLSRVFGAFQAQSGNTITDYREQFGQPAPNPALTVDFNKMPFWPTFDRLLDQAGLTLYPYGEPRALNVVAASDGKPAKRVGRANYRGPFRFEAISLTARRDLQNFVGQSLVVSIEAAWEPRLQIIYLTQRMADIEATDDRGGRISVVDRAAQPEIAMQSGVPLVNLDLPLRLPSRDVREIAQLKGSLSATIAGRQETFSFPKVGTLKASRQRLAHVTVTLDKVRRSGDFLVVMLHVRFDEAGDALASHRQWILDNPAFLEDADGKRIPYESSESTSQGKNEAGVAYRFKTRQSPDDLTLIYQTPGVILVRQFDYELKNIPLP